jgi:hypothetical protein
MAQLLLIARRRLDDREQVRQLLGALSSPTITTVKDGEETAPAGYVVGPKVEYNVLIDNEDVEAWLTQTKAMTTRYFMAILFRSARDDSPNPPRERYLNDNEYAPTRQQQPAQNQESAQKKARRGAKQ